MASTIDITCPHCTKVMKGPGTLQGKKIRCKSCGETFTVPSGSAQSETFALADEPDAPKKPTKKPAGPPTKKPPAAPAATTKKPADDEDEEGGNYGLTEEYIGKRCPHCAGEMEEDQRVCLECGYDTVTRTRHGQKKTYEITGGDWFWWLLPGIVCAFVAFGCCISDFVAVAMIPGFLMYLAENVWGEKPEKPYNYFNMCSLWTVVISFGIIVPCFRFALKRLVFNYTPPEVEKK
jgi:hypothetical protein